MTTDLLTRTARTLSTGLATATVVAADDEALYAWVADHLGVCIPRRACCPEHRAPFDAYGTGHLPDSTAPDTRPAEPRQDGPTRG